MINNKADELDIKMMDIAELNKSFMSEENKAFFSDFPDIENMDLSDIITSSSKYTQSISDANLLLNEISSKLYQSEGCYSTLLNFFEQMKILIYDQDSNISNDDTAVSLVCKSIIDQTVNLQEENKQMKLSINKLINAFDNNFLKQNVTKDLSCSLPKDEPASYYIDIIDKFISQLNKKDDQNTFNKNLNSNSNNSINNSITKPENSDQQKLEKMAKIIKDLKQKAEKIKTQKYISDAGIKRIERQLINDIPELVIEDNDEKYDKIVNVIKKLQEKCKKLSKVCLILQSNFDDGKSENEVDHAQIVKIFSTLKNEINILLHSDPVYKVKI